MDKKSSGGVGVLGVLQIVFIVLKCIGTIDWSWWSVFIPTWISLGLIAVMWFIIWAWDLFD